MLLQIQNEIIPIIDLEQAIEKNIESGLLDEKDVEMINLLKRIITKVI